MRMTVKTVNGIKVCEFEGKLDTQKSADAQTRLTQLIQEGDRKFLLDFEKLGYISSAGLRILLVTTKQLKTAGGELRICCPNEVVREVLVMSGFVTFFKVFESEIEALEGF